MQTETREPTRDVTKGNSIPDSPSDMRSLGKSGLKVAPLALGGNVFGWTVHGAMAFAILDTFIGEGFNLIDTANVYSYWVPGNKGGESETIIGTWLRQRPGIRRRVILATKVGYRGGCETGGLSRASIEEGVNASLKRLNTDYIDLYQSHIDDDATPLEETLDAHARLIKSGKVRAIGASNYTSDRLEAALKISAAFGYPRYEVVQPEYNLYERRKFEGRLADLCIREKIGVIPYLALASGFLTGKYRTEAEFLGSRRGPFLKQAFDTASMFGLRGQRILSSLSEISAETGATPAQISLAWLISRGVTAPIVSATTVDQLKELLRGVGVRLPRFAMSLLNGASAWDS